MEERYVAGIGLGNEGSQRVRLPRRQSRQANRGPAGVIADNGASDVGKELDRRICQKSHGVDDRHPADV